MSQMVNELGSLQQIVETPQDFTSGIDYTLKSASLFSKRRAADEGEGFSRFVAVRVSACERVRAGPPHRRTWPERPARRRSSGARAATPAGSRGC